MLIRWCWVVLLTGTLAAGLAYQMYMKTTVPEYEATSSIYILKDSLDTRYQRVLLYNDLLGAELIAADSKVIIPSITLCTEAADRLGIPVEDVSQGLAVRSGDSERVLVVSSTGTDPEKAARIVNELVTVFTLQARTYFPGVSFRRLDDTAQVSEAGSMALVYATAAGLLGACFAVGCLLLASAVRRALKDRKAKKRTGSRKAETA
jgi:capsular polysaccharide biosynthesis protein